MRTKTINVYSFDELNEDAKKKAIQYFRELNWETGYAWESENWQSYEKFAELFPINVREASYGGRGEGVSFSFTDDYNLEDLKGLRLAKYIWNNYKNDIYTFKYYGDAKVKHCIKHKRIKSKEYKNGNFVNAYHSAITIEKYNCPFTGYCMDNEILDPLYKFLDKPDKETTFYELLEDCFNAWVKACNADREDQDSDEYLIDTINANEYEFNEEGNLI